MANVLHFTQQAVEAIQAPNTPRITYLDAKVDGLQLRVTLKGVKTFSLYRWTKATGRPTRVTLGKFPDMTVQKARDRALKLIGSIADGQDPAATARAARGELTLQELFDEYTTRCAAFSKRPDKPAAHWRLYLAHWGRRRISSLTHNDVDLWHKRLGKTNGQVTANNALKLLHTLYNRALYEWRIYLGVNPAHGIKKFAERSRERFLQAEELPYFWAALAGEASELLRDYFLFSILTGARRANCLAARWQDLNLERGEWRVPAAQSKNGDAQSIVLAPRVVELLRARKDAAMNEWVFPSSGRTGHLVEPKKAWTNLIARAQGLQLLDVLPSGHGATRDDVLNRPSRTLAALQGWAAKYGVLVDRPVLAGLRIHDLRRSLGSWQAMTGSSLTVIGKSLNHKSVGTTAIYARLDMQTVRDSVQRASEAMLSYDDPRGKVRELKVG